MSNNRRLSISLTDEIDDAIVQLKKTDKYCLSSYSEIVREILRRGLECDKNAKGA